MTKWKPQQSDYEAVFASQNPWQLLRHVPAEFAPTTYRPLASVLWQTLIDSKGRRHQIILGPRRVGKTTVMYQTVQKLLEQGVNERRLWWLRMDHPLLMEWDLGEMVRQIIESTAASHDRPAYVFLDELTYAEKWDLWLKTFYDERWPVRIVATSSATAAIRQRGTESGVGRWDEQFLAPYLFTEYLDLCQKGLKLPCRDTLRQTVTDAIGSGIRCREMLEPRRRFILTGGFPELLLEEKRADDASELLRSQRILRSDAIEKALYKDIPQAFAIQDPSKLERLLYVLAGQIGGILSPRALGKDLEMSSPTVERYIDYLERAFIIFTIGNFSTSEESIQRRGRKLYFVDGAVRNAALLRGISPIDQPAEMGILIENMVASHLRALAYQDGVRVYHWRQKNREVDLVYDHPKDPLAFEITSSKKHTFQGIEALQSQWPKFKGSTYLVGPELPAKHPTSSQPGTLPLDLFLVAIGKQAEQALILRAGGARKSADGQLLLF